MKKNCIFDESKKEIIMKNPCENIVFVINGYFVEKINNLYHVFIKGITHATCDSAYSEKENAISRCEYLERELNKKLKQSNK